MLHVETQGTLQSGMADSLVRQLLRAGAHGRLKLSVVDEDCLISFMPGRVDSVSAGVLEGSDALLRIAALAEGDWTFEKAGEQQEADLDDGTLRMLGDLDRQLSRWMRYVRRLGGLERVLAADESQLSDSSLPGELKPFAQEFDGEQSVLERILGSTMNDLTSLRLTSKLVEQGILVDAASLSGAKGANTEAAAASWLEGNSGVFESPLKVSEAVVEEHFGAATELPTSLPELVDEGDSPFSSDDESLPEVVSGEPDQAEASLSSDVDETVATATDPDPDPDPEPEPKVDPFIRFDSPSDVAESARSRILAEVGQSETEAAEEDGDMDEEWFNSGTDEDPHDFDIDYHKSSNSKYYIAALLGFGGLGAFLFMNSDAPKAAFNIDHELVELDKLISDKSCFNAKEKMAYLQKNSVRTAHKLALQQRANKLKKCEKDDQRMMQAKGLPGEISVTGGDFSVATSKDLAAAAIAAAQGDSAINYDQTARLSTKTAKNFGRFVDFGEQVSLRLDDLRRTQASKDGTFSVGLKLTIKARKKDVLYEMLPMKLRDNAEGQQAPRWWQSAPSDAMVPALGSGKIAKGRMISGWVTFHGLDEKVKWPSFDYHPGWEPKGFAAGLADDLSADFSKLLAANTTEKLPKDAPKPALKAPTDRKPQAKSKPAAKRVARKARAPREPREPRKEREPRIVSKDPLAKARSYLKKRDSRRVLAEARRVLRKAPGNGEAHYLVGWAQVQMGTFQSARQSLSKATSLGAPPDAWYNLGLAYQMLGDDQKAITALQRFVVLAPGHKNSAMARETLEALQ